MTGLGVSVCPMEGLHYNRSVCSPYHGPSRGSALPIPSTASPTFLPRGRKKDISFSNPHPPGSGLRNSHLILS